MPSAAIKELRAVVRSRPPVATGVLPVPKDASSLFYAHGSDAQYDVLPACFVYRADAP
jgi:hypothetical protein